MAEQVLIVPDGTGGGGFPIPATTGFDSGGSLGGALGLLLPAILFATLIPALIPPAITTPAPAATACPVCAASITCTTPAPCVPTPTCPDGFMKLMNGATEVPNKCYLFLTKMAKFIEQLQMCTMKGGTLANPMSPEEGLAIKAFLKTNFADTLFYFGYTDLGSDDDVLVPLSGGATTPIPGLGKNAAVGHTGESDCTTVEVDGMDVVTTDNIKCTITKNAVCEVNLSTQKCVCP